MPRYNIAILDNGAQALVRKREEVATLKQLSEKLYKPLVQYIGRAKVAQGALAGTSVHTVQLPFGTLLCYPSGVGFPEESVAEPWGVPSSDDEAENVPKKYRVSRRRRSADETDI